MLPVGFWWLRWGLRSLLALWMRKLRFFVGGKRVESLDVMLVRAREDAFYCDIKHVTIVIVWMNQARDRSEGCRPS